MLSHVFYYIIIRDIKIFNIGPGQSKWTLAKKKTLWVCVCLLVECLCDRLQKAQGVGSHVPASPLLNELSICPTPPLTQSALPDINESKYLTEGFVAKTNENFIVHITLSVSLHQMLIVPEHLFFPVIPFSFNVS